MGEPAERQPLPTPPSVKKPTGPAPGGGTSGGGLKHQVAPAGAELANERLAPPPPPPPDEPGARKKRREERADNPVFQDMALVDAIGRDLARLEAELRRLDESGQRMSPRVQQLEYRRLELARAQRDAERRVEAARPSSNLGCTELGLLGVLGANTVGPHLKGEYQDCVRPTAGATTGALIGIGGAGVVAGNLETPGRIPRQLDTVVDLATRTGTNYEPVRANVLQRDGGDRTAGKMAPADYARDVQSKKDGRQKQLFAKVERDLALFDKELESKIYELELEILGVPVKVAIRAHGRLKGDAFGSLGPGMATLEDYDGQHSRARIDIPATGTVTLDGSAELEAAASLAGLDAAKLEGELALTATGSADLAYHNELMVRLDEDGNVVMRPIKHGIAGTLDLRARLDARAALSALGKELWRGDWTLAEARCRPARRSSSAGRRSAAASRWARS